MGAIATADALLTDRDYTRAYREWGRRYPACSWGARFHDWLFTDDTVLTIAAACCDSIPRYLR